MGGGGKRSTANTLYTHSRTHNLPAGGKAHREMWVHMTLQTKKKKKKKTPMDCFIFILHAKKLRFRKGVIRLAQTRASAQFMGEHESMW